MALESDAAERIQRVLGQDPQVTIFLKPIAAPAAMGLAGFASSTWVTSTYIARWWGSDHAPNVFFPFIMIFGGVGQFVAGIFGYPARDTLVTVMHVLWGSFWISIGIMYLMTVGSLLPFWSTRVD